MTFLFRIPINHYFSTRYTEMLVAEAYSLRYKRLKNLEFSIKTLDYMRRYYYEHYPTI